LLSRVGALLAEEEGELNREERVALEAYKGFSVVTETGGAVVLTVPTAPASPMLNRVVGLGLSRPATEADVDDAIAALPTGVTFYVAVGPEARPAELPAWLAARGLEPGWGWMSFRRAPTSPPAFTTSLRLARVTSTADAAAFAHIQRVAYGLPEELEEVMASAPAHGWECWLALDGDEPAGAGALYVAEGAAYLGLGATLPEHRGKGAQGALLAHRIARAGELGCDLVVTETGERRTDSPSNSYRNILRAGFHEVAVTANWVGTRT
jgi:GNAT superfamily N-acetyltransferase